MKRAIVTGGTRGIGLAVVRLLIKRGYHVRALYARDELSAKNARELVPEAEFMKADVSKEDDVLRAFSDFPALDLLVNNAGVALWRQVQDTTKEEWERVMNVNAGGTFLCCKHAVRRMLEGGGAIVNVSSVWGSVGGSCESAYSASKGAIISLTKALAKELAPSKITVNCICPGVIDTAMNGHLSDAEKRALAQEISLGRFGTPEEVASAVLFLAEHPYITGQILGVDGGFGL